MRSNAEFLSPSIVEPWLRKYQVLPGRCHPEMNGMPHGGFLLTCIRVYENAEAHSVLSGRRAAKRRKIEDDEEKAKLATVAVPIPDVVVEGEEEEVLGDGRNIALAT